MKKLMFFAAGAFLLASCSSKTEQTGEITSSEMDSAVEVVTDTASSAAAADTAVADTSKAEAPKTDETKEASADTAKYDGMLDQFESKINKCNSLAKQGLTINDQKLADVWMEAGNLETKLDKAKKKMSPEQQSRYKTLASKFRKFCETQPA